MNDTEVSHLRIGEVVIRSAPAIIRTELGSCVAVVLYDKILKLGGMTHIMLPDSRGKDDTRYADVAVKDLCRQMQEKGSHVAHTWCGVYGGAMPIKTSVMVHMRNLAQVQREIEALGLRTDVVEIGGTLPRLISLNVSSGLVSVKNLG